MNNSETHQEPQFDTSFRYAIIAGWLILPALNILFSLISRIYFLAENTAFLKSLYISYIESIIFTLFYLFVIYVWVKRKKILPLLMISHFAVAAILRLSVLNITDKSNWLHLLLDVVWILYFIRSKRVKATFVN